MTDLDKEIETLVALREATREAREAAKDLRAEVKAAREARAAFFATPELEERLGKLTGEALARYSASIDEHIKKATVAVYNLTETERTRRCSFCGAMPGQRCKNKDGSPYRWAHAAREPGDQAHRGPLPGSYGLCATCHHPGGRHVVDQSEPRLEHCRDCEDCTLYAG